MKQIWQFSFWIVIVLAASNLYAQNDSLKHKDDALTISGFIDVYYSYNLNQPPSGVRQSFFYNYRRHNEFNINLAFIKLGFIHEKYRANLALQTGTYPNTNYAAEPSVLKGIFEGNAGVSLNRESTQWLDAGVFASHIGFESAISVDNWTLTRSILAENSPYYLSGIKWTYSPNAKWTAVVLLCNGWQRIQKVKGNSLPSFGTQIQTKPNDRLTLNWSTFVGTDDPDSTRRMRYFNNLYAQYSLNKSVRFIIGFDIGAQQKSKNSNAYNLWLSPVMIGQYIVNEDFKMAFRTEYYQDRFGTIINTPLGNAFEVLGFSWNIDYFPTSNVMWRMEASLLTCKSPIFEKGAGLADKSLTISTSLSVKI